jgi:hypothetical protein
MERTATYFFPLFFCEGITRRRRSGRSGKVGSSLRRSYNVRIVQFGRPGFARFARNDVG